MNLQNLRWPVVIATMAITLGALFGTGFIMKSHTVDEPLNSLYRGSAVVEEHKVELQNDGHVITVTLRDTPDFETAYKKLNDETRKILGSGRYTLKVADHRTPQLEQVNRRVNLYVHEALATGQFAVMAEKVEQEAAKAGATAYVAVDSDRVYVQLKYASGYLYNVVERNAEKPVADRVQEGGLGL